jgi:predicted small lipoprotein YifL
MKNTIRILGIIALAAVMALSMAACGDDKRPTVKSTLPPYQA